MSELISSEITVCKVATIDIPARKSDEYRLVDSSKQIIGGAISVITNNDCLIVEGDSADVLTFSDQTPKVQDRIIGWGIDSEKCKCCPVKSIIERTVTKEDGTEGVENVLEQGCRAHIVFKDHLLAEAGKNLI